MVIKDIVKFIAKNDVENTIELELDETIKENNGMSDSTNYVGQVEAVLDEEAKST